MGVILKMIVTGMIAYLVFMPSGKMAFAFDYTDIAAVGAAYLTHLGLHEIGHNVVAGEVGGDSNQMNFFKTENGNFFLGYSSSEGIPEESKLPYSIGGERMAGITFEYALQSYRKKPTTYNKALMFFSGTDFLWYTLYAYYVSPGNDSHDPNFIKEEMGCSKEALLSFAISKALLNTYRMYNEDANFVPMIALDKNSAVFLIRFSFN